jgi:hypothetical protein
MIFLTIREDLKQLKGRVDQQPPALSPPLGFDLLIISEFSQLFEEFRQKRFNLL